MKANAVFSLLTSPHGRPVKGQGPPESGSACQNLEFKIDWVLNQRSSGECRFTWNGSDEMDQVEGDGSAELLDDGSIEIEFAYHNGDEAVLKAKRDTSSTAC